MKRKVSFVTAALLMGSMLAVPASAEETVNYYGYDEPVTIKIGLSYASDFSFHEGEDEMHNNWVYLYQEHNIMPEVLYSVDSSQAETKMSTAIISGDYPDIIGASVSDYINYANTDVIADITDVFEEYATDELKEYLNVDGGLSLDSVKINGRLYGLPLMGNSYDAVQLMFIRQDWLDNLGLSVPKTMDELKEVAYAFTHNDPDQNGVDDTYGLALDGTNLLTGSVGDVSGVFAGYGAYPGSDGMAFVEGEDGRIMWGGSNADGMKAGLKLLQEMYADGSIATDFITMDGNAIFEEVGSGRCGIWFGPMWGAMVPASNIAMNGPEGHIVCAPIPDGLDQGTSKAFLKSSVSTVYAVSSKCEHPEVLIKLMNLSVQKLCHPESDEEFFKYYGSEKNSGWKNSLTQTLAPLKNYDNYRLESAALQSGDTSELNAEQLGDYTNMKAYLDSLASENFDPEDSKVSSGIALYTVFGDPNGSYAALDQMIKDDQFVYSAYNALPTDVMAENASTLKKLTVETMVKIITGDPVESYDSFLDSWNVLGGEDVVSEAQAWADAN